MKNLSTSFQCNFDANICGMTQDKTDKANFILHRWSTRNRGTGPLRDHTTGRGKILQSFNVLLSFTFILFQASTSILMVMSGLDITL